MQAAAGAAARAGYTTRRVRQLADVHRLEGASAVGTRVSAVGVPDRGSASRWSFPLYIFIYYIYTQMAADACATVRRAAAYFV